MKLQFSLITAYGLCLNSKTQLEVIFSQFEKPNKNLGALEKLLHHGKRSVRSLDPRHSSTDKRTRVNPIILNGRNSSAFLTQVFDVLESKYPGGSV